jgi:hypothetical protein
MIIWEQTIGLSCFQPTQSLPIMLAYRTVWTIEVVYFLLCLALEFGADNPKGDRTIGTVLSSHTDLVERDRLDGTGYLFFLICLSLEFGTNHIG